MTQLSTPSNLFDFFHQQVETASSELIVELSGDTRLYLASLLTERARSDRDRPSAATLAELHAKAIGAPPVEQARTYRELGDRALYAVGYFEESLNRKLVGRAYYEDMGSAAYNRVDALFKRLFSDAFGPVFGELAGRFTDCVGLLSSIRATGHASDAIMRLYEEWLATGDEEIADRLRERGLVVRRGRIIEA